MWTWRVVVAVQDAHGRRASFKVFLPTEHYDYDQAAAWLAEFLPRLDAVIGGVVVDARIERELSFPDLAPEPEPGARVEVRMQNAFALRPFDTVNGKTLYAGKRRLYRQAVPTWDEALTYLGPLTQKRYRASWEPAVLAFENLHHAAETLGHPAKPSDARGIRVVAFHKAGKGLVYGRSRGR